MVEWTFDPALLLLLTGIVSCLSGFILARPLAQPRMIAWRDLWATDGSSTAAVFVESTCGNSFVLGGRFDLCASGASLLPDRLGEASPSPRRDGSCRMNPAKQTASIAGLSACFFPNDFSV